MATFGDTAADLGELFVASFRRLRRSWAQQLAPFELTPHQWRALATVPHHSPGSPDGEVQGIRLKDLAERLRIAPRSATEVVDQLQDKGLVRRDADPTDRRATLVVATESGDQLYATVSADRKLRAEEYFSSLSSDDRTQLARILGQLRD